jgi:hypothetical protein
MSEIWVWTLEEDRTVPANMPDLVGLDVEATDGHIGKIDEASDEAGAGSIVVDTGFWIFGKKRLIPAGLVERVDRETRVVHLSCTKEQVERAPDYDELRADDPSFRVEVGTYFDPTQYAQMGGDPNGPTAGTEHR